MRGLEGGLHGVEAATAGGDSLNRLRACRSLWRGKRAVVRLRAINHRSLCEHTRGGTSIRRGTKPNQARSVKVIEPNCRSYSVIRSRNWDWSLCLRSLLSEE